jgi:MFS family permease
MSWQTRPAAAAAGFRGLRALQHRNYRLFFGGQVISLIGTWMQQVAQAWLVFQLTGDPFMLGVVAAAQFLPVMLLGLFGGLIADQLPKRQTLLVTQAVSMVLAFLLFGLTVTDLVQVWHIVVLALLLGTASAVEMPTRQSFVVEMVGRENIGNAVGLNSAVFNGARVVGPAIAGLTIGAFDISVAFLVNGFTFLAVIASLMVMRDSELRRSSPGPRPHGAREIAANVGEGLRYVRRTPMVLLSVVVISLVATFGLNFSVLVPALAQDVLGADAIGFGFLMTASGIGSVLAALAIAFARGTRPWRMVVGTLVLGAASVALAMSQVFALSMIALFFVGAGSISVMATANTTIQLSVPDQLRGRVMSVYTTMFVGTMPIGSLIAGFIASRWGVPLALGLGGVATVVIGLGAFVWLTRIRGSERAVPAPNPAAAQATAAAAVPAPAGVGIGVGDHGAAGGSHARPR